MFYDGDIQSGISVALQNGKSVVCFVTNHNSTSELWEKQWLRDKDVVDVLSRRAVLLRIDHTSEEFQQLSAVYPISEPPTLLIVNEGKVDLQVTNSVTEEEFKRGVLNSFPSAHGPQALHEPGHIESDQSLPGPSNPIPEFDAHAPTEQLSSSSIQTPATDPSAHKTSDKPPQPYPSSSDSSKNTQQETYLHRQARQKREALQERERIRALIEADKLERKARETRRRQEAEQEARQEATQRMEETDILKGLRTPSDTAKSCSIQCRLLDGSTIRSRFEATDTLQHAVRSWIDLNRTSDTTPYSFRLILTPQPSQPLDDSDEQKTLADLGLIPSSSLALVPVKNFSEAYRTSGSKAVVRGAPQLLYGYFASILAFIYGVVQRLFGWGNHGMPGASQSAEISNKRGTRKADEEDGEEAVPKKRNIRISTLRDQQDGARDEHQLYNGNTLNFEPEKKDENGS